MGDGLTVSDIADRHGSERRHGRPARAEMREIVWGGSFRWRRSKPRGYNDLQR